MSIWKHLQHQLISENYIVEISADDKYAKQYDGKLDREVFDQAVALDPTSKGANKVGQYVDWIIKHKAWGIDTLKDVLFKFNKKKNLLDPDKRDINKLNPDGLIAAIKSAEDSGNFKSKKELAQERKAKAAKEAELVYNTDKYVVVVPKTQYASQYYGAGSDWCTARQEDGSCQFNSYNEDGTLYIVFNKETKEKHQLFVNDNGESYEYRNNSNEEFDPKEEFDEELLDWMKEKDFPEYVNQEELFDEKLEELFGGIQYSVSLFDEKMEAYIRDIAENDPDQIDSIFPDVLVREADKLFKILANIGSNRDMIIDFSDEYMGDPESFLENLDNYSVEDILADYFVSQGPWQIEDYRMINRAVATGVIDDVVEYVERVVDDQGIEDTSEYQKFFDAVYMYARNGDDVDEEQKADIIEYLDELGYSK